MKVLTRIELANVLDINYNTLRARIENNSWRVTEIAILSSYFKVDCDTLVKKDLREIASFEIKY